MQHIANQSLLYKPASHHFYLFAIPKKNRKFRNQDLMVKIGYL
jgi:hypothetical protein